MIHYTVFCRRIKLFSCPNYIDSIMVSMLASTVVDGGSTSRIIPKTSICCFYTKHTALRSKSTDWLSQNQDNVSEWSDVSIRGLLFQ
jgi:hypothetical protein